MQREVGWRQEDDKNGCGAFARSGGSVARATPREQPPRHHLGPTYGGSSRASAQ
jgi:hypothetical protein